METKWRRNDSHIHSKIEAFESILFENMIFKKKTTMEKCESLLLRKLHLKHRNVSTLSISFEILIRFRLHRKSQKQYWSKTTHSDFVQFTWPSDRFALIQSKWSCVTFFFVFVHLISFLLVNLLKITVTTNGHKIR